jgi:hypothetical protein
MMDARGGLPRSLLAEAMRSDADGPRARERTQLHVDLRAWAAGPLTLEHPQGSSYHHMLSYDLSGGGTGFATHPQIFVVERDWARAFAGYDLTDGECPLPFPECLFEFRISGVRVLAFYDEERMVCVYGRGGAWVADDYCYDFRSGRGVPHDKMVDATEFPRVARLVMDNVRVACIMIDAEVAVTERVPASQALVQRRVREGRAPPRNHYVVDLKRRVRHEASKHDHAPSGRAAMRGHFRRGTWVHYEDPDSGRVQYADAGGFWHSRTWRPWHFAGDPNNVIDKEYRL